WRDYFEGNGATAPTSASTAAPAPRPGPEVPPSAGSPAPAQAPPSPAPEAPPATTTSPPGRGPEEVEAEKPDHAEALRGISGVRAQRMDGSLEVPTATSYRTMPAKLLEVNRVILNNQLQRLPEGGKVSFTHLIGWAVVRALREHPEVN